MRRIITRHALPFLLIIGLSSALWACDKKGKPAEGAAAEGAGAAEAAEAAPSCSEKNALSVTGLDKEELALASPFALKATTAWMSGMQGGGETRKLVYIAMADYDVTLGSFGLNAPKNPGENVIQLGFTSEFKKAELSEQKAVYRALTVPKGDYPPEQMAAKSVQLFVFRGEDKGRGMGLASGATGKATITDISETHVCGTVDLTTKKGATVKGSFSAKIEKDMWK